MGGNTLLRYEKSISFEEIAVFIISCSTKPPGAGPDPPTAGPIERRTHGNWSKQINNRSHSRLEGANDAVWRAGRLDAAADQTRLTLVSFLSNHRPIAKIAPGSRGET